MSFFLFFFHLHEKYEADAYHFKNKYFSFPGLRQIMAPDNSENCSYENRFFMGEKEHQADKYPKKSSNDC